MPQLPQKLPIPRPFMRVALSMMRRSVRKRAHFSIDDVAPLDYAGETFVPVLFGEPSFQFLNLLRCSSQLCAACQLHTSVCRQNVHACCMAEMPGCLRLAFQAMPPRTRLWGSTTASGWWRPMPATRTSSRFGVTTTASGEQGAVRPAGVLQGALA